MGRVASGIGSSLFRSATRLGPLDVLSAGLDYTDGKNQGEDDIRAAAGAAGSTLGGWGGAMAGATAGAALGPIGAGIGAIVGGTAGGFAGGWGADRADDLIRGNNNQNKEKEMATFNSGYMDEFNAERQRQAEEQEMYRQRGYGAGDFVSNVGAAGAVGAGVYGVAKSAKDANFINPFKTANELVQSGISRGSANQISRQALGSQARSALKNIPVIGKAALALGAGKLVDDATGGNVQRMIGGGVDAVTGNAMDFDSRGDGRSQSQRIDEQRQKEAATQRQALDEENQRRINALPSNNPYLSAMQGINEAAQDKLLRRQDQEYERGFRDRQFVAERATQIGRENYLTEIQAKQASELMNAYARDIPMAVTNQLNGIFNARYT